MRNSGPRSRRRKPDGRSAGNRRVWTRATEGILRARWRKDSAETLVELVNKVLEAAQPPWRPMQRSTSVGGVWFAAHRLGLATEHEYQAFIRKRHGRKPVPERIRQVVMARDGHRCLACGATEDLSVDHVMPVVRGGTADLENLQTLCRRCNRLKFIAIADFRPATQPPDFGTDLGSDLSKGGPGLKGQTRSEHS